MGSNGALNVENPKHRVFSEQICRVPTFLGLSAYTGHEFSLVAPLKFTVRGWQSHLGLAQATLLGEKGP